MYYKRYNKTVYGLQGLQGKPKVHCYIFLFLFVAGACSLFLYVKEINKFFSLLEQVPARDEYSVITLPTTAYSEYDSCHTGSSCLMANGEKAYYGAVASNCLPFGTTLIIDNKEFIVKDRHSRFLNCRADLFFGYGEQAYINAKRYGVVNKLIKLK